VSLDTNLTASSTASVAVGPSRRITYLLAAVVGLATLVLLVSGGGTGNIAYAQTTTITAKGLTDHECDETEWHFVITGVAGRVPPASITVTWDDNGTPVTETVPLDRVTGNVAHYVTTSNLDLTLVSATAVIFTGWSGQFNLSHGPCEGPTPTPTKPTSTQTS
jgi:hypothetical protein